MDSLSERELRDLFEEIFGEPSDEEIAEALREAEAEYKAGDYSPTPLDDDDEPYREPTRQEILASIRQGYKEALAGGRAFRRGISQASPRLAPNPMPITFNYSRSFLRDVRKLRKRY